MNNIPGKFFEYESELLNENTIDFNDHRNMIWNEIVNNFYKNNGGLKHITGKVIKVGKIYNSATTFTIENKNNDVINVYIKSKYLINKNLKIGVYVGLDGYFNIYKNTSSDNAIVQFIGHQVNTLTMISPSINEFEDYVKKNKKNKKLIVSLQKKYKVALITSFGSEAREDIKSKLSPFYILNEYFVNLFDKNEIASTLTKLNNIDVDIIIISRGGTEKLNVFDEEIIVNNIYNSNKIIITALGHASSKSKSDIVADYNFNTPSSVAYELNRLHKEALDSKKKKKDNIFKLIGITIIIFMILQKLL